MFRLALTFTFVCSLSVQTVLATTAAALIPPTDAQIEKAVTLYSQKRLDLEAKPYSHELRTAAADEALKGIDLSTASLVQFRQLQNCQALYYTSAQAVVMERLKSLAEDPTPNGLDAAIMSIQLAANAPDFDQESRFEEQIAICRTALHHPALVPAWKDGSALLLPRAISKSFTWPVCDAIRPDILSLEPLLTDDLPDDLIANLYEFIRVMAPRITDTDREEYTRFHAKVLHLFKTALDRTDPHDSFSRNRLELLIQYMDGVYAKAQLFGYTAPLLGIHWASHQEKPTDLDDYRGKVVILEFWSTWCTSCIAGFPEVRQFVERYRDYPVVVLGATELYGFHITGDGQRIECPDDPEKEIALMRELIGQLQITWPVVYGQKRSSLIQYGIAGIPSTIVIEPDGNVLPQEFTFTDLDEASAYINAILDKFDLPSPPQRTDSDPHTDDRLSDH